MTTQRKIKVCVNSENVFRETVRKEEAVRLRWAINWEWYIERLRQRERDIANYKKSNPKALGLCVTEKEDNRSVLPFPVTTSMHYGWLASRKEFELEVFGPYYENFKQTANPPDASSSTQNSASEYGCEPKFK